MRHKGDTVDTLNLTINGTILFALGFVVYAVVYEICANIIGREAAAQFGGHAFTASIQSFVKPAQRNVGEPTETKSWQRGLVSRG